MIAHLNAILKITSELPTSRQLIGSSTQARFSGLISNAGSKPLLDECIGLFFSVGNAWSGSPFIESAHDLHELASQQDERAPQYEGDAIE